MSAGTSAAAPAFCETDPVTVPVGPLPSLFLAHPLIARAPATASAVIARKRDRWDTEEPPTPGTTDKLYSAACIRRQARRAAPAELVLICDTRPASGAMAWHRDVSGIRDAR